MMKYDKTTYFNEINILRALAIGAVISVHTSAIFVGMDFISFLTVIYMSVDAISHFAVPLFIFISGFVLYHRYAHEIVIQSFYAKRFIAIIPPYLIFSTFYMVLTMKESPSNFSSLDILYNYVTGNWYTHLWFFVLIIQLYLLYPLTLRLYNYSRERGKLFELLFVSYLVCVLYNALSIQEIPSLGPATLCMGYMFYFIMGMVYKNTYEEGSFEGFITRIKYYLPLFLLIGTIGNMVIYAQKFFNYTLFPQSLMLNQYVYWVTNLVTPFFYLSMTIICLYIARFIISYPSHDSSLINKIGSNSFGIYLIHPFIMDILISRLGLFAFTSNNWLFYPLIFTLTLALSYASVIMIRQFPYSKYIVGDVR
jgi:peptidoglycan/LPS O-acetylase OafA/YrhL